MDKHELKRSLHRGVEQNRRTRFKESLVVLEKLVFDDIRIPKRTHLDVIQKTIESIEELRQANKKLKTLLISSTTCQPNIL